MNKVVTINLNGYLFNIDETAYARLNKYLHELSEHFATTEGGSEIVNDIETRIAELLREWNPDSTSVVMMSDVEKVIAMMGEPWQLGEEKSEKQNEKKENSNSGSSFNQNKIPLRRDTNSKIIGGVCSGAGQYLGVDPVIFRLLFAVSFFVFGSGFLLYIILWMAIPAARPGELESSSMNKRRLYRDAEDHKLGGVCAGLGYYFGIDPVWFRLGFLVAFFIFGTGLILYIIFWIAFPKAVSSADKLRMKGQPVDIDNLEKEYRNNASKSENTFAKTGSMLSELLSNIFRLAGKFIGFISFTAGLFVLFLTLMMIFNHQDLSPFKALADLAINDSIISLSKIGSILMAVGLCAVLLSAGIRLLFNVKFRSGLFYAFGSSIFFAGMVISAVSVGRFVYNFHESATNTERFLYNDCPDTLYIQSSDIAFDSSLKDAWTIHTDDRKLIVKTSENDAKAILCFDELRLVPAKDSVLQLILNKTARAATRDEAQENARKIKFNMTRNDSSISISNGITIDNKNPFAFQNVRMKMRIPVGTVIVLDDNAASMLEDESEWDNSDDSRLYLMTKSGIKSLDEDRAGESDEVSDQNDDEINVTINTDDEESSEKKADVSIHVDKENKKVEIHSKKKTVKTKTRVGPVKIETTESDE